MPDTSGRDVLIGPLSFDGEVVRGPRLHPADGSLTRFSLGSLTPFDLGSFARFGFGSFV